MQKNKNFFFFKLDCPVETALDFALHLFKSPDTSLHQDREEAIATRKNKKQMLSFYLEEKR